MVIQWNEKTLPVICDCDIAVVGAGPGGIGAAVIAGKRGKNVAVFEQAGRPGGCAALCEVSPFLPQ